MMQGGEQVPTRDEAPGTSQAAERLRDVLVRLFGRPVPVRIRAWDGTESGPPDAPLVDVRSRRALRRVLWRPDELGLGRAFVAGEVTVPGSLTDVLERLAELGGVAERSSPTSPARPNRSDRRELLRTAVLLGAVGPQPKAPEEETGTGLDPIPEELARLVLGDTLATGAAAFAASPEAPDGQPDRPRDLDAAQATALTDTCVRAGLRSGSRVLDLRAGWGAFLRTAGERGVRGRGCAPDAESAAVANRRLAAAGLSSLVAVRPGHWQEEADGAPYDAIVAPGHWPGTLFDAEALAEVRELLRPGGRLCAEVLTRRAADEPAENGLVPAYLGTDAALPTLGEVVAAVDRADLEVLEVVSLRGEAAATVRAWVANLEAAAEEAAELAGTGRARLWRLLLAGLATGLWSGKIGAHRVVAVRDDGSGPRAGTQLPGQHAEAS